MKKPTIYIDFDNTMVDSILTIVNLYNQDFCAYQDFRSVNPNNIFNWNFKELTLTSRQYINQLFNSPRFFNNLKYMENAETILWLLSFNFNFTIVSCGDCPNLKLKEKWLNRNFCTYINEVKYINHAFVKFVGVNSCEHSDKSHIDMSDGILIDDSLTNLVTSNAKYKILFGKEKDWNIDNGDRYVRCENWIDVMHEIERLKFMHKGEEVFR